MIARWAWLLFFSAVLLLGLGTAGSTPICSDPAGCVWLRPGESLIIPIPRITSGTGRGAALAVQQRAELAASRSASAPESDIAITIQPYFSACLPEVAAQSTIDLAALQRVPAVLGPTCELDAEEFLQRMSNAGLTSINMLPFTTAKSSSTIAFVPDERQMARQAANLLRLPEIFTLAVMADPDPVSQTMRKVFCAELAGRQPCRELSPEAGADTGFDAHTLWVWISMQSEPVPPELFLDLAPNQPALAVSLSPPPAGGASRVIFTHWIGPAAWQDQEFISAYTRLFQTAPLEFAGLLAYSGTLSIRQAALETAERLWDGSWLIPRQVFRSRLSQIAARSDLFQYSCPVESSGCPPLPLTLYQWTGKEYKFVNP